VTYSVGVIRQTRSHFTHLKKIHESMMPAGSVIDQHRSQHTRMPVF
jgi:hypothetical protein